MFDDLNNLEPSSLPPEKKKKFLILGKIPVYIFVIGAVALGLFSYQVVSSDEALLQDFKKIGQTLLKPFRFLTLSSERQLKGEKEDRVNLLLLGMGGLGHEGGFLTDSIILASYKPSTKQVAMLSVPRDLVMRMDPYGWRKINSANALGEINELGKGPEFAGKVVSELTGVPVHYYLRVDFSGFKKLIDEFGGIDIYLENRLEDYQYPIRGKELVYPLEARFEHLKIEKGWHHFDGSLALKYARSRHALGVEGSDFARSKRQQKVILALKDKVFSYKTLLQPGKIGALLEGYGENVSTSLEVWEIAKIAGLAKNFGDKNVINKVLDNSSGGPLVSTNFNGIFILEPRDQDYSGIKKIAQNIFDSAGGSLAGSANRADLNVAVPVSPVPPKPEKILSESAAADGLIKPAQAKTFDKPKIEVLNGTKVAGLAKQHADRLEAIGFEISKIDNAARQDFEKTVLYNLNGSDFPLSARELSNKYALDFADKPENFSSTADFVLIVGADLVPQAKPDGVTAVNNANLP